MSPVPVKTIPIVAAQDPALSACGGAEPFALMVLGDAMAPEFREGYDAFMQKRKPRFR